MYEEILSEPDNFKFMTAWTRIRTPPLPHNSWINKHVTGKKTNTTNKETKGEIEKEKIIKNEERIQKCEILVNEWDKVISAINRTCKY